MKKCTYALKPLIALLLAITLFFSTTLSTLAEAISEADRLRARVETFVYQSIYNEYATVYDTFEATLYLNDGTEVPGFAYSDYSEYYESEDGTLGFFPAGFIADVGYVIPRDEIAIGQVLENRDYDDEAHQFIFAYETEPFGEHAVKEGKYIRYGVGENGALIYETQDYQRGYCDESRGALYSYDENRFVYNPNLGNYVNITGETLYTLIDYQKIEEEINRNIEQQNANFSKQSIVTSVTFAQEAAVNYLLSLQEETFLGYNVKELVEYAKALDPMECIRITPEGFVIIDIGGDIPNGPSALAKWTVGICCGITVIGSVALTTFVPWAVPFSGAISGAAIDVFIQVVIENQNVENVDWRKVAVAATTGAVVAWACPLAASSITTVATKQFGNAAIGKLCGYGIQTLSNGIVSGVTNCANAAFDGQEVGWNTFLSGFGIGSAITAGCAGLTELVSFAPKVLEKLAKTKAGPWIKKISDKISNSTVVTKTNKVIGKTAIKIQDKQIHLPNEKLESILAPKSVHQAAKLATQELKGQVGAKGGAYKDLKTVGDGSIERHELPSHEAFGEEKRGILPAIQMDADDHRLTASFGSSADAKRYRAIQANLINEGKFMEAMQMDIDDLTSKFGAKYAKGIKQALDYARASGW